MNMRGLYIAIYSFFSLLIGILCMYISRSKIPKIRRFWAKSMINVIGIEIEEIGTFDKSANLIVLNHNSMLDIIILDYLSSKEIAWVANMKLANISVFGWIFKLPNLILIDPQKKNSFKILINKVKKEIDNQRLVGIFPEGTRGDTNNILKFKKGTKIVAEKLNLKVQPIVLINTRERLDTKNLRATAGKVKVIYLKSIVPSEVGTHWFSQLEESIRNTYHATRDLTE